VVPVCLAVAVKCFIETLSFPSVFSLEEKKVAQTFHKELHKRPNFRKEIVTGDDDRVAQCNP
jgi:hypothetical protein